MANKMRWKYGETNPVLAAVDSATVIAIGDLVYQNTDDALPASDISFAGGINTAQEAIVDNFLGVAMQASASGDTTPIRVATSGVFEFDCASTTFELGTLLGADDNAGGTAMLAQQVITVTDAARAVGRCAQREGTATTTVLVSIESTVMTGGPQKGEASA